MIRYGVWNGIKYDNTLGNDKTPEGLDLKALMNFNPGNPIDVIIGNAGFLVFDDSVSLAGRFAALLRESVGGFLRSLHTLPYGF